MTRAPDPAGDTPAPLDPGPSGRRPITPVAIAAGLLDRALGGLDDAALPAAAAADLRRAAALLGGLDPYLEACTSPPSAALVHLDAVTSAQDWAALRDGEGAGTLEPEMLSGHVEGQLLQLLARVSGARRALDVGTFTGYSALAVAEALPADGHVVGCELDPRIAAIAQRAFDASPHGARITLEVGPALDTLHRLADAGERFDLAFLDADKAGYVDHLDVLLDRGLLRPGGLLVADNTLFQGEAYLADGRGEAGAAIAAFNRRVADDDRLEQVLLPLRDGVTVATVRPRDGS